MKKKDLIHYAGAAGIFLLVVFIMLYLAHNKIPTENKDIIVSIVGMIVGSLSVVIYAIIGRNPDEVRDLTVKIESQQKHIEQLVEQKDAYEAQMIQLQQEIIKAGSDAFRSILEK
jgi:NADH:ubiquinone oxidoreductase subunit 6 (subunit J)|tara:strand:- start:2143 stop:2487 length:345 start_codon:yes stop_codon:yes gene_type:complete